MDTGMEELMRRVLGVPEGQTVIVWEFPGIRGCPLAFHQEEGLANCPLGFDHQGVPHQLEPWMMDLCEDESSKQRWKQILAHCQLCQGKARPSSDEGQGLQVVKQYLFTRG
jgi:hypothetical protein